MKVINNKEKFNKYIKNHTIIEHIGENILKNATLRYFEKDEKIMEAGNKLDYYYLIVEGNVRISYCFENGKSILLKMYHPFNSIGDIELFENKSICSDVIAGENCYLIAISAQEIRTDHWNNTKFLHHMINTLGKKLSATMNNSSYNLTYPLVNRVASFLVELSSGETSVTFTISYQEVAQFLGATYRHLNRTLKELEDRKIIKIEDKSVQIINREELEILSRESYQNFL